MTDISLIDRLLDVIEHDIVPKTADGVAHGNKLFGAAILRKGCWSYVFGDLAVADGPDLVAAARLYAGSTDRLMPWRGRPDKLKRGLVARIPPLTELKEIS